MSTPITSLSEFIEELSSIRERSKGYTFFRGHADRSYTLSPSVFRSPSLKSSEPSLLEHFEAELPNLFTSDKRTVDRLVRAQHYGIATRLLDFTLNPLMALYFACKDHADKSGQVIAMRLHKITPKFANSDTVSCLANLSYLSDQEKTQIGVVTSRLQLEENTTFQRGDRQSRRDEIAAFNEMEATKRLVQFVKEEKPYFLNTIDPLDLIYPTAMIARKNNERILAQSGVFLIYGMVPMLHQTSLSHHTDVLEIPESSKQTMLNELDAVGINEYSAFPEPEKIAKAINSQYG